MHEDQGDPTVEHMEYPAVDRNQGDHDHLEGDDHGSHHQGEEDGPRLPGGVADDYIGRHGRQKDSQDRGADGHEEGVAQDRPEVHLFHGLREVLKGEPVTADQSQRLRGDVRFGLKDVDDHQEEGSQESEEENDQNQPDQAMPDPGAHARLGPARFLPLDGPCLHLFCCCTHQASTSPFLPK